MPQFIARCPDTGRSPQGLGRILGTVHNSGALLGTSTLRDLCCFPLPRCQSSKTAHSHPNGSHRPPKHNTSPSSGAPSCTSTGIADTQPLALESCPQPLALSHQKVSFWCQGRAGRDLVGSGVRENLSVLEGSREGLLLVPRHMVNKQVMRGNYCYHEYNDAIHLSANTQRNRCYQLVGCLYFAQVLEVSTADLSQPVTWRILAPRNHSKTPSANRVKLSPKSVIGWILDDAHMHHGLAREPQLSATVWKPAVDFSCGNARTANLGWSVLLILLQESPVFGQVLHFVGSSSP